MHNYQIYDETTAPEQSRQTLKQARARFGLIPNLMAVMAESPALVNAYGAITQIFEQTSFSDTEKQLVLLTVSHENSCHYCMAAHSTVAQMKQVPAEIVAALRDGQPLADKKLEALRQFVRTVVKNRGHANEAEINAFLDAGYSRAQIFDVLVGVGMKTLSNYTNHLTNIPIDAAFQPQAWKKAS